MLQPALQLQQQQFDVNGLTQQQLHSLLAAANTRLMAIAPTATAPASWRQRVIHPALVVAPAPSPAANQVVLPHTPSPKLKKEGVQKGGSDSESSTSTTRQHEKNDVSRLATFLTKNYLKGKKVWRFLYEGAKYMDNF